MKRQRIEPRTTFLRIRGFQRKRSGFTLLELLLVLMVMVTLAALSWPRLTRYLQQQGVQDNAEQVRQLLDRARVRAVEEGRTLQMRFEPHGRHYVLLPYEPVDPNQPLDSTAAAPFSASSGTAVIKTDPYRAYTLSEDCHFHVDSRLISGKQTIAERLADPWTAHLENGLAVKDIAWSAPILYYPDGSASDGSLVVMDAKRRYIKLHVRGLTGAVTSAPLALMSERLGSTGQ
jgi:prepilin-type N-terminal cleavage/methylation domain-containing protein